MFRLLIFRSTMATALAIGALMLIPESSRAVDGVLEINASCAAVGCFPGDAPGYPVTLASHGAYRLTSDLEPAGANGIEIGATVVDLDLGGFAIRGPGNCSGAGGALIDCVDNAGVGIDVLIGLGDNVTARIHNGTITGMTGGVGLFFASDAMIEDLRVTECSANAISLGSGAAVRNVYVSRNGGNGILAFLLTAHYSIQDSVISLNGGDGINAGGGIGSLRGNLVYDNAGWGLISEAFGSPAGQPSLSQNNFTGNDLGQLRGGTTVGGNFCSPSACP
jgi:hypothetical protein